MGVELQDISVVRKVLLRSRNMVEVLESDALVDGIHSLKKKGKEMKVIGVAKGGKLSELTMVPYLKTRSIQIARLR